MVIYCVYCVLVEIGTMQVNRKSIRSPSSEIERRTLHLKDEDSWGRDKAQDSINSFNSFNSINMF